MANEDMHIVYNCDEGFAPYVAVSIVSLLENNRDAEGIHIHLLKNGMRKETAELLRSMVSSYGSARSLEFADISDMEQRLKELTGRELSLGRFGAVAFGRILAPELVGDADRLLYIDGDTLVLGSLKKLWQQGLKSGSLASMAMEPTIYPETKSSIGLSDSEPYYNSGVILMDAVSWRKERVFERAVTYMGSSEGSLSFPDQDVLNIILRGRVTPMPQRYNFMSGYTYQSYKVLRRHAPWFEPPGGREGFERARKHPAILHFAGDERPWIAGSMCRGKKLYRSYQSLTPWRDMPPVKGKRLYMLFYHLVDLITLAAPELRYGISHIYYMTRISKRSER